MTTTFQIHYRKRGRITFMHTPWAPGTSEGACLQRIEELRETNKYFRDVVEWRIVRVTETTVRTLSKAGRKWTDSGGKTYPPPPTRRVV